jgi:four helix bundle protein
MKFNLEERTLKYAKEIVKFCKRLERNAVNKELISQLIRSAGSVGANYREANESMTKKDFIYRIKICLKESKESSYWLELINEANEELRSEITSLLRESVELKKIFSSISEKSS